MAGHFAITTQRIGWKLSQYCDRLEIEQSNSFDSRAIIVTNQPPGLAGLLPLNTQHSVVIFPALATNSAPRRSNSV